MSIEHKFDSARLIGWATLWSVIHDDHVIILSLCVNAGCHWIEVRGNSKFWIEFFLRIQIFGIYISSNHLEWVSVGIKHSLVVFPEISPVDSNIHSRALLDLESGKVCIKLYLSTFLVKAYLDYWVLALLILVLNQNLLSPLPFECLYRDNLMREGQWILIRCFKYIKAASHQLRARVRAIISEVKFELSLF